MKEIETENARKEKEREEENQRKKDEKEAEAKKKVEEALKKSADAKPEGDPTKDKWEEMFDSKILLCGSDTCLQRLQQQQL